MPLKGMGSTMKLDRLIGILTILLQTDKTTAPELARRFEVSRRTILRDIDALAMAGIPIVTARGGDGGVAIMDGYKINKSVLTADELQSLVAALKGLDSVSKRSNFESLMDKLAPGNAIVSLAGSVVIDFSGYHKDSLSEKIALIKKAIAEHRPVSFDYYYAKGEVCREIEPYCLEFRWNAWYVFGWCREREDFRRFKLNRLWDAKLEDGRFTRRPVPEDKASAAGAFLEQHTVWLRFDPGVRFRLIEDYGLNCYEETEHSLLLTLDYANKDYILSWILGFGDKAEVLGPAELREEYMAIVKNMADKYRM
jgi:predicted DNA-binding transcriptional regulator YafY